jgi:AcrR family transcriptional regulator
MSSYRYTVPTGMRHRRQLPRPRPAKEQVPTARRILDAARILINERGVSGVSVRGLAEHLGMSPSNLQYHFPSKRALLGGLIRDLYEVNAQSAIPRQSPSLRQVHATVCAHMRNHLAYRGIVLGFLDCLRGNPELLELDAALQVQRVENTRTALTALVEAGVLHAERLDATRDALIGQLATILRFWLHASELTHPSASDDARLAHYAWLIMMLFAPYCTDKGRAQLARVAA